MTKFTILRCDDNGKMLIFQTHVKEETEIVDEMARFTKYCEGHNFGTQTFLLTETQVTKIFEDQHLERPSKMEIR
jgi:hypothetical protein